MSQIDEETLQVVSRRPPPWEQVRQVWQYRELLTNLIRKELRVKYKNSALGFAWSLLTPALYLVVFSLVFQVFLDAGIPRFAIFFLAGLIPWAFFANSLSDATASMTANPTLVQRVWFPRQILPFATIGAGAVNLALQLLVLLAALAVFSHTPSLKFAVALLPALFVLFLFTGASGLVLSALNAYYRDTEHAVRLGLLAWFWMTPVVYPYRLVADRLGGWSDVLLANPLTPVVLSFQRALYNRVEIPQGDGFVTGILPDRPLSWYLLVLGIELVVVVALALIGLHVFARLEDDLAEVL